MARPGKPKRKNVLHLNFTFHFILYGEWSSVISFLKIQQNGAVVKRDCQKNGVSVEREYRTTPLTPIVSTIFRPYPTKGSEYFCTFAPLQASGHGRMGGHIKALTAVVFVAIGIPAQASAKKKNVY